MNLFYNSKKVPIILNSNICDIKYVGYVEQIAQEFNLPCLNMFKKEGWDFTNEDDVARYTCVSSSDQSVHDGLHPNNLGHKLLTENHIERFVIDLMS